MTLHAAHAHVVVRTAADAVILIRRVRQGRVYYLVPGTEVLDGETPGAAAVRAAASALGIGVKVEEMLYAQAFAGVDHFFFMATARSELLSDGAASGRDHDDWELERELGGSYEIVQLQERCSSPTTSGRGHSPDASPELRDGPRRLRVGVGHRPPCVLR